MNKENLCNGKFMIGDLILISCSDKDIHTNPRMTKFNGYWLRVTKLITRYSAYPIACSAEYFHADNQDKQMPLFNHEAKEWVWVPEHVSRHISFNGLTASQSSVIKEKASLPDI